MPEIGNGRWRGCTRAAADNKTLGDAAARARVRYVHDVRGAALRLHP